MEQASQVRGAVDVFPVRESQNRSQLGVKEIDHDRTQESGHPFARVISTV